MNVALPMSALSRGAFAAASLALLAACGGDKPTEIVKKEPITPSGCAPVTQPLAAGESVLLPAGQHCVQLTTAGSNYTVAVVNTGRAVGSLTGFELVGSAPNAAPAPAINALGNLATTDALVAGGARTPLDAALHRRVRAHSRVLETSRDLLARLGGRGALAGAASPASAGLSLSESVSPAPTSGLKTVGDTATLRVPDINASSACSKFFEVSARVAYVSQRAVILEDVKAPLAGQMNDTYKAIGDEFDTVMWPILTGYFGNPLKLDAQLDGNNRIVMLFSPVLNDNFPDIAGFVIGCDFFPRTSAPSSNEGEMFYAMVPKSLTGSVSSNESRDGWLRTMRSTIIHEAKHITSFVERISSNSSPEESWLEEATARHSEELYARTFSGAEWKGDAGYDPLYCEVRPTTASCVNRPYVMFKHFDGLYDYLGANGTRSPLGKSNEDDFTFYASGWSLVRWASDLASSESAFFRALTAGPASGTQNLEGVTGRAWGDIVSDWTMAMALDNVSGSNRSQNVPSWNQRAVYAGMNADFPNHYTAAYPLRPPVRSFGNFTITGNSVRGGSGFVAELSGAWAGTQRLEVRLPGGGTPSNLLRLVVTRTR